MDTLHSFRDKGIVDRIGIGGNPEGAFWQYVKKENFEVVSSFLKMDACSLEGFAHDIPRFREEGLAVYAASSLHMGLLGSQFKKFINDPPNNEWIQQTHVENAVKVNRIAMENGLSLTNLALRYLFAMNEADRVVLGPKNMEEVQKSISIWEEGPVDKAIFDEVTEFLLKSID
jgi:aryl-alcohol dehydrogenase-like predicted oxidoreductase